MEMGMTPELMYGQNVYVPATANPYPYGYTEVGSPMEWYNHQSSLGYDGQEIYYPGFQTEGMQCVSYAAPDNGSIHPSYSPYPMDPSFIVDGSFLPQEYVADASDPTCQLVPSSYYIPSVLPYAQDGVLGSTTTPLQHPNFAYVPSMPGYAATSTNPALPSIAPGAMKNGIVMNPPIQSTVVSSKQFHDHAKLPKAQLHNLVPLKQELANRSMVPVKFPHTSQACTHLDDMPISSAKHPPKVKLSANNSFGFVGSDPHKWAAAEKFQPTSKPNGHLNGASQKVHLPNNSFGFIGSDPHKWAAAEKFQPTSKPNGHLNGANQKGHLPNHNLGDEGKPSCQRSSTLVAKSYTSRLSVGNLDGTVLIRTDQYNSNDLRVDYPYAKFFVIKSIGEADVHKSIKYGVWSSSSSGNNKLDSAYRDADRIAKRNSTKCPVFLFFSVNGSGHFCGMAEMVGPVDFQKDMDFWFQDKWTGSFPVRWHIIKDVPNYTLQHILLQNNENKPVTHSRDTQEVPYIPGIYVLKILKDIKVKECLLDDFMRYEEDEARTKEHRRSKLSHNAPDFVPVSQRRKDASDAQQPKLGSVLIDRTLEIQNVSEKPHDCNVIKHQDPCLEAGEKQASEAGKENGPGEKQGSEAGKENGHQEKRCNGKQGNEKVAKTVTNQPQTSNLKTSVDGKQQYWKKVELPRQTPDTAVHGSSKAPEKHLNGVKGCSAVVTKETPKGEIVVAKVGSLAISTQTREADNKSRSVDVVTIGSMPVRVNKSDG